MNLKKFTQMSREYFGTFLSDYGFAYEREKSPIYFRKNEENIYHFVSPCLGSRGVWFDIMVFAHSPLLRDDFYERFPENLGVPSDVFSFLHPVTGVGRDQMLYRCRTEEGFIRNFNQQAKPALEQFGLLYLDKIQTLDDIIATIPDHMKGNYNIPFDGKTMH